MLLLGVLASLPYVAAVAMYWVNVTNLFRDARGRVPSNWSWSFVSPVVIGGLTPLALAGKSGLESWERWLLLTATGVATLYVVISMGALRGGRKFFQIQLPISIGSRQFGKWPWWRAMMVVGTLVIVYAAAVNIAVALTG